jgi:hypothetical protein
MPISIRSRGFHFAICCLRFVTRCPATCHLLRPIMNAEYWEKRTAMVRNGAVRVISLAGAEEVDYWRDQFKSARGNTRKIELMTLARNATVLRGRAHYGCIGEIAEYVFRFTRDSKGKLLKFGLVAFSKSEDRVLACHIIDIFGTEN